MKGGEAVTQPRGDRFRSSTPSSTVREKRRSGANARLSVGARKRRNCSSVAT